MKDEILAAVVFLVRFIEKSDKFPRDKLDAFKSQLIELLTERFKNHWFPDCPAKGQGYRCIRVNELHPVDVVLQKAATLVGLSYNDLQLPIELTLWVDPNEVCCRFGESEGSYCTLATFSEKENQFLLSSSESPTSERSVSPASDISSGSVEMPTNMNNMNNKSFNINSNIHEMKKGTPKKYRNNIKNNNSISPIVGYNNYSTHHKHSTNYAPNNLVQQQRHAMGGVSGNRNISQLSSQSTWRTNYYEILPHFALNNGGSYNTSSGYNNYNRPTYPRVSQFQNVLTV